MWENTPTEEGDESPRIANVMEDTGCNETDPWVRNQLSWESVPTGYVGRKGLVRYGVRDEVEDNFPLTPNHNRRTAGTSVTIPSLEPPEQVSTKRVVVGSGSCIVHEFFTQNLIYLLTYLSWYLTDVSFHGTHVVDGHPRLHITSLSRAVSSLTPTLPGLPLG